MVRSFTRDPVAPELVDRLLRLASQGPSAGNTWGTHFVVLEGPDQIERYWDLTLPLERRSDFAWPGLLRAPVLVLPCGDAIAYFERYSEADKAPTGLGEPAAWSIPYWHVDTAMATMILLHAAVDAGLGALFFGLFDHEAAVAETFDIPAGVRPIGTVAIGWSDGEGRPSRSANRGRPPADRIVHRGRW